mgnify:CR=1 FL=1
MVAPPPQTRIVSAGADDLRRDVTAWDALAACAAEPNPFYESWYLLPSFAALDPHLRVRCLRFEVDGMLAGLLPITRQLRYYRWPMPNLSSWIHENCFLGVPLVAAGLERLFWQALLDWADRHCGLSLFLHLRAMPLDGALYRTLDGLCRETGRELAVVLREERALLQSDVPPDAYFDASLSGKKRKELRRQFARLEEQGALRLTRLSDDADLDRWIDDFLALEASGWKGRAGSALASHPATTALFRESLRGAAKRERLERLSLTLDARPIALLANFLTPPGAFSYKTAFDEAYARFSPGVLLQRENLAMLQREGIEWADSCAAADHPMINHIWRQRRAIGRVSVAIGGKPRRALFHRIAHAERTRSDRHAD